MSGSCPYLWISVIVFFLTSILSSYGVPEGNKSSKAGSSKPTFAGQFAFVGTVDTASGQGIDDMCIVTAVTEKWVLTVYSCFVNLLAPDENLTISTLNMASVMVSIPNFILTKEDIGENKVSIDKIIVADDFGEDRLVLIRLATPISKDLVSKVAFANEKTHDTKRVCITLGWKPAYYPGFNSSRSQDKLRDISLEVSTAKPGEDDFINGTILGQSVGTNTTHGICKFESGSPLLCEVDSVWNFVGVAGDLGDGVTSNECQSPTKHTVYISLEPCVEWIVSQIRETDQIEEKHD